MCEQDELRLEISWYIVLQLVSYVTSFGGQMITFLVPMDVLLIRVLMSGQWEDSSWI